MEELKISLPIRSWADEDKPREKLIQNGRATMSNAELLAILIGSGNRQESAVQLSQRILNDVDHNLNHLGKLSVAQLKRFKGIGEAKAVTVAAALELGRRRMGEKGNKLDSITSSKDAFAILYPLIGELDHEEFWVLYLNNSNKVVHKAQLSKGGITGTLVDVRLVMKLSLELGAVGIILAHNHPSGNVKPSGTDRQMTKKMKTAAESLDIKILDHLIVTQHEYLSFADKGIL